MLLIDVFVTGQTPINFKSIKEINTLVSTSSHISHFSDIWF